MPRVPEPAEILTAIARLPGRLRVYVCARDRRTLWALLAAQVILLYIAPSLIPFGIAQISVLSPAVACARGAAECTGAGLLSHLLSSLPSVGSDPRLALVALGIASLLAILVLFETLLRTVSWRVAVLTAALVASAPWGVLAVRSIGAPALALPLSTCLLCGLLLALIADRPWGWAVVSMCALLLLTLSPDGLPALCLATLSLILWPRRASWPHLALGALLGSLVALPTLYDTPSGLPWSQATAYFAPATASAATLASTPLVALARLLGGAGLGALVATPAGGLDALVQSALLACGWLCLLGAPVCLWYALSAWARWRQRDDMPRLYVVPALWVTIAAALYLWRGQPVSPEQLAPLLTPAMLAAALMFDGLLKHAGLEPSRERLTVLALAGLVVVSGGIRCLRLYDQVADPQSDGAYGTPLQQWKLVTTLATRGNDGQTDPLWVISEGTHTDDNEQAVVLDYLLGDEISPLYTQGDTDPALLLPAERGARYLVLGDRMLHAGALIDWGGEVRGLASTEDPERVAMLIQVPAHPVEELLAEIPERVWAAWDAGLRLVGYDPPTLAEDGRTVVLATYWTFEDVPAAEVQRTHRLELTVSGSDGTAVAIESTPCLAEVDWTPGRLVKQWHAITMPYVPQADSLEISISLSRVEDGYRNLLLDDAGRPIGDHIIIGPVSIPR